MSYQLYINGKQIETRPLNFSRTKQVNDIANLRNRNSNFTSSIRVPISAKNTRELEKVGLVGNQSNLPYRRNVCDLIDTLTGEHLVYKGWAVLIDTTEDDYVFSVYDGIIDFYRAIDGLTINDIGVSELNHIKNIENIIQSWINEESPYRYILADYNGKSLTDDGKVNIDFQIPAALVKFLWNKIFNFIGFEYEGIVFGHEDFENLWLTYPKPAPTTEPLEFDVTEQKSQFVTNEVQYPIGFGGVFYGSSTSVEFLPNNQAYDADYYSTTNGVADDGMYRFSFTSGSFTRSNEIGSTSTSQVNIMIIKSNGTSDNYSVNIANANYIDISLEIGDRWIVGLPGEYIAFVTPTSATFLSGNTVTTKITKIEGYTLGFDQAFIDYKVSDFIREIMIRFGLTPFKDKYKNKIVFKTLFEVLQNNTVVKLDDSFVKKTAEKYVFGEYAKRNVLKYKYNDENMTHNDGFIQIDNENLADEYPILNSSIFSPERLNSLFLGGSNVYKIWEKEVKDDGTLQYKDLDKRFYLMRAERINSIINIKSELLADEDTNPFYYRESFYKLSFRQIISSWYPTISKIFNKAKMITGEFNLNRIQINNFRFDVIYFIDKLSSYFLANKLIESNGRNTKLELIEIDYFTQPSQAGGDDIDFQISIGTVYIEDCRIFIPVTTNYELPIEVELVVYTATFDVLSNLIYQELVILPTPTATLDSSGIVSFDISQIPSNIFAYRFGIRVNNSNVFLSTISGMSNTIIIDGSCYLAPVITNLIITSVNQSLDGGLFKIYQIAFSTDAVLPVQMSVRTYSPPSGLFGGWTAYQEIFVEANTFDFAVGVLFGDPTKFQIKIGALESPIFDL